MVQCMYIELIGLNTIHVVIILNDICKFSYCLQYVLKRILKRSIVLLMASYGGFMGLHEQG